MRGIGRSLSPGQFHYVKPKFIAKHDSIGKYTDTAWGHSLIWAETIGWSQLH